MHGISLISVPFHHAHDSLIFPFLRIFVPSLFSASVCLPTVVQKHMEDFRRTRSPQISQNCIFKPLGNIVTILVTIDGFWIGNRIYCIGTTRNYK
jgi:hypothetical protein